MPELRDRFRRVNRPWRILFVVYALALTTGTHWPALKLPASVPVSDKGLHMMAFGFLTIFLWRTQWIRSRWLVGILVAVWSMADEYSQGIPGLNRHVGWEDGLANLLGVITVLVWLWALRPLGGGSNRARLACLRFTFEEFFSRWTPWLTGLASLAICAVPGILIWRRFEADEKSIPVLGVLVGTVLMSGLLWARPWLDTLKAVVASRPCSACASSCAEVAPDESGHLACPSCGKSMHAGQWDHPAPPTLGVMASFSFWPAVAFIVVLAGGFTLIAASSVVYAVLLENRIGGVQPLRLAHTIGTLPASVTQIVDLTAYLVLVAVAVRIYRGALGRYYDQAVRCRKCGHDLRGTPTDGQGRGRCGECGAPFVRLGDA